MSIIPDEKLITIPINDNGEKLVNLRNYCPKLIINIEPKRRTEQNLPNDTCYVRETVASKLSIAQRALPRGFKLMIRDAYRPLKIQKRLYLNYYETVKHQNPNWTHVEIKRKTDKFVAPIEIIPPHSTGGAVDLTIVDSDGNQLDMGTELYTFSIDTYTNSKHISKLAMNNRKMLISVMTKAGFINYPIEWWHWTYGDRYWAAVNKKEYSIYKGL